MSGVFVIARRELAGLFKAPFAWLLLLVVLVLNGMTFRAVLLQSGGNVSASLDAVMAGRFFLFWLLLLPPLLAMRLVAEETRTGTLEYLLTAPVSDASVVVGKFIAGLGYLSVMWASALVYAFAMARVGGHPDWPAVFGTYIGAVLLSSVFVALGILMGTLTGTPLLAAFLGVAACVIWMLLPYFGSLLADLVVPLFADSGEALASIRLKVDALLANMDAIRHFQRSFQRGVFDSSELVFFMSWTALFLFLATRSLEARRWRG
ncbi:MAG: ABC transporter permease [Planctomycetota bacterium]